MTEPILSSSVVSGTLTIEIDEGIYTKEAVLRTAYWFIDRCYLLIRRDSPGRLSVQIKAKAATLENPAPESLENVAGEFTNSLLEYQLRHEIESETGSIRELLIAKAFSDSDLLEDPPPGDPRDPVALKSSDSIEIIP
jgi:His-Xaa-Ser system protein HxsD